MQEPESASAPLVHQALASSTRRALLERLRQADQPLDATSLAEALDLHITTVRGHLSLLDRAGLVASTSVRSGQPGRPRTVYSAAPPTPTATTSAGYHLLAEILIDGVSSGPVSAEPSDWARELGRRWGPRLVDRMGLRGTGTPTEVLHASFEVLGFEPETTTQDVRLHACPFVDLAMGNEEVVCGLHLGLARGMLASLDTDVTATDLVPFAAPSLCILALSSP